MPHKHKRRHDVSDASFDLPPTQKALPLPVSGRRSQSEPKNKPKTHSKKTKNTGHEYGIDDTPRAWTRLLASRSARKGVNRADEPPSGSQGKKRKRDETKSQASNAGNGATVVDSDDQADDVPLADTASATPLRIQPGERLAEFAVRVNQTLPVAGISTKGKKVEGLRDHRITRHERHLKRLQGQWREDNAKIREREEEKREEAEDAWEEQVAGLDKEAREVMSHLKAGHSVPSKKKRKRKGKLIGEVDDDDNDPWAVLKERREEPKGLFDVNKAPPKFDGTPRAILKAARVKDVPRLAGSLKRREDLGEARAEVIRRYRDMMKAK